MLRTALVLAILAVSAPAGAADSDSVSDLDSSGDLQSVAAFAILFVGLARLVVTEKKPRRASA